MAGYRLSPVWGSACRRIPRRARQLLRDSASLGSGQTTKPFVPAEVLSPLQCRRWGSLPGRSDTRSLPALAQSLASVRRHQRLREPRRAISDLDPCVSHRRRRRCALIRPSATATEGTATRPWIERRVFPYLQSFLREKAQSDARELLGRDKHTRKPTRIDSSGGEYLFAQSLLLLGRHAVLH